MSRVASRPRAGPAVRAQEILDGLQVSVRVLRPVRGARRGVQGGPCRPNRSASRWSSRCLRPRRRKIGQQFVAGQAACPGLVDEFDVEQLVVIWSEELVARTNRSMRKDFPGGHTVLHRSSACRLRLRHLRALVSSRIDSSSSSGMPSSMLMTFIGIWAPRSATKSICPVPTSRSSAGRRSRGSATRARRSSAG